MLGILLAIQEQIGKGKGDTVHVDLRLDTAERVIDLDDDVTDALAAASRLEQFRAQSYSHQREYAQWIAGAKRPETRQARVAKMLELLAEGKRLGGCWPPPGLRSSGALRDEVWRVDALWLVTTSTAQVAGLLRPPADVFFETTVELGPLTTRTQRELLRRRLDDPDSASSTEVISIAAESAGGQPRRLLEVARELAAEPTVGGARLNTGRGLKARTAALAKCSRPARMLAQELEALGWVSASDERLLSRMGWTRPRVVQVIAELEGGGLVEMREENTGRGRPRKLYRLTPAADFSRATHRRRTPGIAMTVKIWRSCTTAERSTRRPAPGAFRHPRAVRHDDRHARLRAGAGRSSAPDRTGDAGRNQRCGKIERHRGHPAPVGGGPGSAADPGRGGTPRGRRRSGRLRHLVQVVSRLVQLSQPDRGKQARRIEQETQPKFNLPRRAIIRARRQIDVDIPRGCLNRRCCAQQHADRNRRDRKLR